VRTDEHVSPSPDEPAGDARGHDVVDAVADVVVGTIWWATGPLRGGGRLAARAVEGAMSSAVRRSRWLHTRAQTRPRDLGGAIEHLILSLLRPLIRRIVEAVIAELDLTRLILDNVDLDAVAARLDVQAVVKRVDVNSIVAGVDLDGKHFAWRAVPPAVVHQEAGREDVDLPGGEEQLVDRFSRADARPAVGADPDQQQGMRVVAMRDLGLAHVRVRLERQSGPVVDRQGGERLTVETDDAAAFEQRNVRSHRAQRPVMKRPASRRTISG